MSNKKADIRFLLVRHGESEANVDPQIYSKKPDVLMDLTPRGHEQAVNMGAFLKRYLDVFPAKGGVCIFTSPYNRARQTAYEAFNALQEYGPKVREYDWLSEQNFGSAQNNGISQDAWFERYPDQARQVQQAREHGIRHWSPKPDGETYADVAFRVKNAIDSAFREYAENGRDTFVIVCHSVTMRQFIKTILNLPYESSDTLKGPDNCDVRLIQRFNSETGHHFGDFGSIWKSGVEQPAALVPHKTTQASFADGSYAWKSPANQPFPKP